MMDDTEAALATLYKALQDYVPHAEECPSPWAGRQPECTCGVGESFEALSTIRQALRDHETLAETHRADIEVMTETLMEAQGRIEELEALLQDGWAAAAELGWAFENTYADPGPGSRIPTLMRWKDRARQALSTPSEEATRP
jgi:hypothetical protein